VAWACGPLLRAKFHPHDRHNVSSLRGEKRQNRRLSNLNNGAAARNAAGNEANTENRQVETRRFTMTTTHVSIPFPLYA